MTDPPRLLEGGSAEADLLEAWASQPAPAGARAKTLALAGTAVTALAAKSAMAATAKVSATTSLAAGATAATGLTGASAVGAGGATVATTGAAGIFAAKWIVALGVVAAVGGTSVAVKHYTSSAAPTVRVTAPVGAPADRIAESTPANTADAPVVPPQSGSAEASPDSVDSPRDSAKPAPSASSRDPAPNQTAPATAAVRAGSPTRDSAPLRTTALPAPAPPAPASSLAGEVSTLDSARAELRSGQASSSLRELDAFDAQYPNSPLAEDAAFLRFDAYVALGDRAGATHTASAILAKYPSSPRAPKVRRWLDETQH